MLPRTSVREILAAMRELRETDYPQLAEHLGMDLDSMSRVEREMSLQKLRNGVHRLSQQGYVQLCPIEDGYESLGRPRIRKVIRIIEE